MIILTYIAKLDMLCDVSLDISLRFIQSKQSYIVNLNQQSEQDSDDEQMNEYYIENAVDCIVRFMHSFLWSGKSSYGN